MARTRAPAVAGSFYPSDSGELRTVVESLLSRAVVQDGPAPRALVVPHAGYIFSGSVAASAYAAARARDRGTCRSIEAMDPAGIDPTGACGAGPLKGLLAAAERRGLTVHTLDLRNSGDTAGSRDRVVGYGAWMFTQEIPCKNAA